MTHDSASPAMKLKQDYRGYLNSLCEALHVQTHGWDMRGALPAYHEDLSHEDFLNVMANLGYIAHHAYMRLSDVDARLLPALFVPNDKQKAPCVIRDASELSARDVSGHLWFFSQAPEGQNEYGRYNDPRRVKGLYLKKKPWFTTIMGRFKPHLSQVLALGLMVSLVSLAIPLFVMLVYDRVIGAYAPATLWPLVIGAGLALAMEAVMRLMRAQTLSWFGARLDYIVSTKVFDRLLHMPPMILDQASVSAQIARIKAFEGVRDFFTSAVFSSVIEIPFVIIAIGVIALIAGPVAFVPVAVVAVYVALGFTLRETIAKTLGSASRAATTRQEMTIETFEKIDALRAGGIGSSWFRIYRDLSGQASLAAFRASFLSAVIEALSGVFFVLSGLAVLVWGIFRVWHGDMTGGALIATMILSWRVLAPIQSLCNALPRIFQARQAIQQVNRLMEIPTERAQRIKMGAVQGDIEFGKVGIRYAKDRDPVFAGLSFKVDSGQIVALSGANGTGKSTILKLIAAMVRPQAGVIAIDGIDIRQFDPQDMRQQIFYLPQNPYIFNGTIAENLRFANPDASDETLWRALFRAGAGAFVEGLPQGIDTVIDEHEKLKIPTSFATQMGLARAYIRDAQIMLFDELPYLFLNSEAGAQFQKSLRDWKGDKTILIVTGRSDYMSLSDQVIFLRYQMPALIGRPDQIVPAIEKQRREVLNVH